MKQFVPVKPEEFDTFEVGKCHGFNSPIFPAGCLVPGLVRPFVYGFLAGIHEKELAKNLPQVILLQSSREELPMFCGTVFPQISETETKRYLLVNFFTELRAVWVDKKHCILQ